MKNTGKSKSDFAVFILSHGRAGKVKTYKVLRKQGYTGRIFIIIDNEDETAQEYYKNYGDEVIMFDKKEAAKEVDAGNNFNDRRTVVFARNENFKIAEKLGIKYFLQLDDDYSVFGYKFNSQLVYGQKSIKDLDKVFAILLEYYKSTNALTLAMAQTGDFIGGGKGAFGKEIRLRRKAMNTFFCCTDRPFKFLGWINEDVTTYVTLGARGGLFLTVPNVAINQTTTQQSKGGLTEAYLDQGTYVKSFYSVMFAPSCVSIALMGEKYKRPHHKIRWKNAAPMILHEKWKK